MIELNLEEEASKKLGACLKVIGIGGAGGNAIASMINSKELDDVNFIVANTDAQALNLSNADVKIQLGEKITKGLGAGSNPEIGRRAAEENLEIILEKVADSDILFLTAGLGGGTGSGALPVIAKAAKDKGILTVAVVTTPFAFEGKKRFAHADEAIKNLKDGVDTLLVVPNQKLLEVADPKITMLDAFALANDVLKQAIKGISDIIKKAGHINVDFADVRKITQGMGMAIMGTGRAEGQDRARQATLKAISSPLLDNISINGARGVLINITGNTDLALNEINEVASMIHDMVSEDAEIIFGSVIDQSIGKEIMVTVIATGFQTESKIYDTPRRTPLIKDTNDVEQAIVQTQAPVAELEIPVQEVQAKASPSISNDAFDLNDLDTPTFLRKKASAAGLTEEEKPEQISG